MSRKNREREVKRAQKHHTMEITKHYPSRGLDCGVPKHIGKIIAKALCMSLVEVLDGDDNMQMSAPYYCIPHEAPR